MWILPLIGYIGIVLGFGFLTLAIASGLYYLSELVEEHTVAAKKLLTRLIYSVIAFQLLLVVVDRFPIWLSLLSIASHAIYLQNLRYFPIVRLSDPVFILSCFLVILNHYFWFLHFNSPTSFQTTRAHSPYSYSSSPSPLPSFTEVASYFFLLIWLVPFALFVSLSAGENVLPSMGSEYATNPSSPLSPSSFGGATGSGTMESLGAMLSPRSLSQGLRRSRSSSQVRDGSLGFEGRGRKKRSAKGLVRVAVDGVRDWAGDIARMVGIGDGAKRF
ncbi:erv26 super protein [Lambiella insularis]|nr:erv26 super protein [Lambiella insularis]